MRMERSKEGNKLRSRKIVTFVLEILSVRSARNPRDLDA